MNSAAPFNPQQHQQAQVMILPQHTFTVGPHQYRTTMLGATRASELLLKLMNLAAEPLAIMGMHEGFDEKAAGAALAAAIRSLDAKTLKEFCQAFGERTEFYNGQGWPLLFVGGSDVNFDMHFAGRLKHMLMWLWECLKFNFAQDFLGDTSLDNVLAKLSKRASKKSEASTGDEE